MAYYYKVLDNGIKELPALDEIHVHEEKEPPSNGPSTDFDFSKHVLIELLDDVTPEAELWEELGVTRNRKVIHKRLMTDSHRLNCRRAIVICSSSKEAKELAQHLSQSKIKSRCVCAIVVHELLSDLRLFEKQVRQHGDQRPQQQLVYVTDLNRCREPSGLVQFLTEKFSPFGTVLSVLVSEDKDGYAFPEGVIRFAYLSEAFAAELAYDQYIVGMERLSVTTHHNILLSQCDLRARLREAQLRHANETYTHLSSRESCLPEIITNHNSPVKSPMNSVCCVESVRSPKTSLQVGDCSKQENSEFPTDSAELADVLENSCRSNLFDCLNGITISSSSTVSNRLDGISRRELARQDDTNVVMNSSLNPTNSPANTSALSSNDQTFPSRVMKWISDLPDGDTPNNVWDVSQASDISNDVTQRISANQSEEGDGDDIQQTIPLSPLQSGSTAGSFFTCEDGGQDSSLHSSSICTVMNTPAGIDITEEDMDITVAMGQVFSVKALDNDAAVENAESRSDSPSSPSSIHDKNTESSQASTSNKRRNTSLLSQKLSLKIQRINSSQITSEVSDSEVTVCTPSSLYRPKECHVVLNTIPELDIIAKNHSNFDSPAIKLDSCWLPQADISTSTPLVTNQRNIAYVNVLSSLSSPTLSNPSSKVSCSMSEKSATVRRSSRLASQQNSAKSCNGLSPSSSRENGCKPIIYNFKNSLNGEKTESPLRIWLKKELVFATNNRVASCQESTKSIVCATMNKDVLISIGCSHMTCDFCYPDSTNLLLGFH